MSVYFIEREYDSNIRVEVDDDVIVTYDTGYDGSKNSVEFKLPEVRYESKTIAAFSDVKSLRKEGVNIQHLVMKETKSGKKVSEPVWENVWTPVENLEGDA